jgi:hypothetical protein
MPIATGNLFENITNMLYKMMLCDFNRKLSSGLDNMEDSNNNN